VILEGGGRSFCIGRDMADIMVNPLSVTKERFRNEFRSFNLIYNYKKPFITLIDGVTFGGACVLAMGSKFRIATERSIISMPETSIGFFGASGSSYFLSRLRNSVGIYMGMTGFRLRGFDLKKVGLATHFVESKKIKSLEKELEMINDSDDVGKTVAAFSTIPMTFDSEFDRVLPRIEKCFEGTTVEQIYENLKQDGSKWAMDTIKQLDLKSPTSLKICHRQLYLGKMLNLQECLKMEFRIAVQHVIESDMKEGCRAMIFDKDENPKWNPKSLNEVTNDMIERFFQPVPENDELTFEN
jgi:3-hydroxyisobutyryl-CoA hydrolase